MDQYENMLKKKLNSRYVNVKKAFLDLDVDNSGTIQAEELAKLIKFSDL
jgi:Ca2+-binding EF-hand superfamily protein